MLLRVFVFLVVQTYYVATLQFILVAPDCRFFGSVASSQSHGTMALWPDKSEWAALLHVSM